MIYKKFAIEIRRRLDVNYIKFCKMVDKFAQNRWDDPTGKVAPLLSSCHVSEVNVLPYPSTDIDDVSNIQQFNCILMLL